MQTVKLRWGVRDGQERQLALNALDEMSQGAAMIISDQQRPLPRLSSFREHCCVKLCIASKIGPQSQKLSDCSEAEAERQKRKISRHCNLFLKPAGFIFPGLVGKAE